MKSFGAFGRHTRMRVGGYRLTHRRNYSSTKSGLMAMFASIAYDLPVFAKAQAFMSLPVVKRGIKRTITGRTLAAPQCGICTGAHPAAAASYDSTLVTYLYQLMHIRNWGNANLHLI